MIATRYRVASELGAGRRVLEVACGSGVGLGALLLHSRHLLAGDLNSELLTQAWSHYRGRVPLTRFSADAIPLMNSSVDVVLCLEALYYMPSPELTFREADRVLTPGGHILVVSANPERPDFIRSPFSQHYHTAGELRALLTAMGYATKLFGAFPLENESGNPKSAWVRRAARVMRQTAEALRIIPRTLEGRARLKRILGMSMTMLPPDVSEVHAPIATLYPLETNEARGFKVIYAVAEKPVEPQ
jgi:ubiquinone/menaquinone biosynthesis C-methylase UbiE